MSRSFLACADTPGIPVLSLRYGSMLSKTGRFLRHFYATPEAAQGLVGFGARALEIAQAPAGMDWDLEADRVPFADVMEHLVEAEEHARKHERALEYAGCDDILLYLFARGTWHALNTHAQAVACLTGSDAYALTPALFQARCGISADDLAQPINTDPRGTVYGTLVATGGGAYRVLGKNTVHHIANSAAHADDLSGLVGQTVKMLPVFMNGRGGAAQPGGYACDTTIAWIEAAPAQPIRAVHTPYAMAHGQHH